MQQNFARLVDGIDSVATLNVYYLISLAVRYYTYILKKHYIARELFSAAERTCLIFSLTDWQPDSKDWNNRMFYEGLSRSMGLILDRTVYYTLILA